jgi:hypothetical protein
VTPVSSSVDLNGLMWTVSSGRCRVDGVGIGDGDISAAESWVEKM